MLIKCSLFLRRKTNFQKIKQNKKKKQKKNKKKTLFPNLFYHCRNRFRILTCGVTVLFKESLATTLISTKRICTVHFLNLIPEPE